MTWGEFLKILLLTLAGLIFGAIMLFAVVDSLIEKWFDEEEMEPDEDGWGRP